MMRVTRRSEKTGEHRIRRFADSPFRRFIPFLVCVMAIAMAGASFAQDEEQEEEASNAKPDAGGVVIEPSSGKIAEGDTITITFPVSMVAADLIDVGDQPSPFVSEPKLDGTFLWKSQTEGVFTVSGVVAEARHRLRLAPGLKDATGKPFVVKDWSAEFRTPKFAITTEFGERKQLAARPQIYLESTYAVRLDEAAQHIYFQDRESRGRFPVEVIQTSEDKTAGSLEATGFRVTPRAALPVGRTFDLIVNGLLDVKSRRPLAYLQVMPAGKTEPLEVQWLGAFNHPLEDPTIRIKFDDSIDPVKSRVILKIEHFNLRSPYSKFVKQLLQSPLFLVAQKYDQRVLTVWRLTIRPIHMVRLLWDAYIGSVGFNKTYCSRGMERMNGIKSKLGTPKVLLSMLKPVEIGRAMKCSPRFDVAIKHRVSHTENSCHHRFGSFVPDVTVIFDNAGIDLHVPVRHVHVADTFYLPKIQFATCPI